MYALRKPLFIALLALCFSGAFAQKKKDIKKFGIRTVTSTRTVGTKTLKDSQISYDKQGEVTEEKKYDEEGNLESTVRYRYNLDGKVIEETEYDDQNVLVEKRSMKYNVLLQKTEEVVTDKYGKQIKKHTYAYNANGLRTEKKTYDTNNKLVITRKTTYGYK